MSDEEFDDIKRHDVKNIETGDTLTIAEIEMVMEIIKPEDISVTSSRTRLDPDPHLRRP